MSTKDGKHMVTFGKLADKDYIKDYNDTLSQDAEGIYTATEVFVGQYDRIRDRFMNHNGNHTFLDWIKLTNKGFQLMKGGLARITCTFKGVPNNAEYVRYRVDSSTRSEPIQTHPHMTEGNTIPDNRTQIQTDSSAFGYAFGRQKDGAPKGSNQAYYEAKDGVPVFKHFDQTCLFNLPGIKEFLDISMSVQAIIVTHASKSHETTITANNRGGGFAYKVGQRFLNLPSGINVDPPEAPRSSGNAEYQYNWLVTACTVDIVGSAMRQKVTFSLSNKKGWNSLLYKDAKNVGSLTDNTYGAYNI
jgi:hypothetical protein